MGLINNNANSEFLYKSSQLITLIQRDDGKKNRQWRRKQGFRVFKARIVARTNWFNDLLLDDGTYVQKPHWTQLIKSHLAQVYRNTGTPCSCWLCKGERYSRLAYKRDTKRIIDEQTM